MTTNGIQFVLNSMNSEGVSGPTFDNRITKIKWRGTWYRVDCFSNTTCNSDKWLGSSGPENFEATSSMAHYGIMFQTTRSGAW